MGIPWRSSDEDSELSLPRTRVLRGTKIPVSCAAQLGGDKKGISKEGGVTVGRRAHSTHVRWPWGGKDLGEAETVAERARGRVVRNETGGSARGHVSWGPEGHDSTLFL